MGYVVEARHWLESALVATTTPEGVVSLRLQLAELEELAAALDNLHTPGTMSAIEAGQASVRH